MKVEIDYISGCEGNCLALNGTRIAGPKPWGGGRLIESFNVDLPLDGDEIEVEIYDHEFYVNGQPTQGRHTVDDIKDKYPKKYKLNVNEIKGLI